MKLSVSIAANNSVANIIVNDDNTKVYNGAIVKQSSGGYCVSLKNVPNAPQKWVSVPNMKGDITDKKFDRDLSNDKKPAQPKAQTKDLSMIVFLESTITACAASEELTNDEVEAITNAITPILDRIKKTEAIKQTDDEIATLQAKLDELLAKRANLG